MNEHTVHTLPVSRGDSYQRQEEDYKLGHI